MATTALSAPDKLLLAAPRGYCAGVDRAVQTVERALDLYAGVGLFARFVGEATGARVVAVEADRTACQHARANLAALKPGFLRDLGL